MDTPEVTKWAATWADSPDVPAQVMAVLAVMLPAFIRGDVNRTNKTRLQQKLGWNYRTLTRWLERAVEAGWLELEEYHADDGGKVLELRPAWPQGQDLPLEGRDCTQYKARARDCTQCKGRDCTQCKPRTGIVLSTKAAAYKARAPERASSQQELYSRSVGTDTALEEYREENPGGRESLEVPFYALPNTNGRGEVEERNRVDAGALVAGIRDASKRPDLDVADNLAQHISRHWTRWEVVDVLRPMAAQAKAGKLNNPIGYLRSGLERIAKGESDSARRRRERSAGRNRYDAKADDNKRNTDALTTLEQMDRLDRRWAEYKQIASAQELEELRRRAREGNEEMLRRMTADAARRSVDAWARKLWNREGSRV